MKQTFRMAASGFIRMLAVAVVTSAVIIGILTIAYGGQNSQQEKTLQLQEQLLREIRNATLAQLCVAALPLNSTTGRDPNAVKACEDKYGLIP